MSDEEIIDTPWPPYPCTGKEQVHEDVELLDDEGNPVNLIRSSACYADWYCLTFGGTWRHYVPPPPPEPVDEPETPAA